MQRIKDFNANRLTLARRRRGLTKTKLAQALGVDLRAVTGYELGEYPPADDKLSKLSEVLEFPQDFFFGDDLDVPTPETASFRALSKMTASQRDMALGEGAIAMHVNRWIEKQFELPAPYLPDLSREPDPEAAAQALRRHWGLGELSIRNMVHLLEANGVRVYSLSIKAREVDAFSMWKETTPFVFLNTYKSSEHSRFDAAHELGHLVLHRHGGPQGRDAEREADAFASAFLMPRASVLAQAPRLATVAHLIHLKKIWTVSVAALNYRLHTLGLTSDWHYRTLCIELSQKGYRSKEPNEAPRETSQVLTKVFSALRESGISKKEMADQMCLSVKEIERLVFGLITTGLAGDGTLRVGTTNPKAASLSIIK